MEIKIIQTGSKGNASVLTDVVGNQLLIDVGVRYERIAKEIVDFSKLTVLITHAHGDHALCADKFKGVCKIISPETDKPGLLIKTGIWSILPIPVPHGGCNCYAYIIANHIEHKKIFWATDLTDLPRISSPGSYDLMAIECNYETDLAIEAALRGTKGVQGYENHLSVERLREWLMSLEPKARNLCVLHLSNRGLINRADLPMLFRGTYRHNFYIGDKNVKFRV